MAAEHIALISLIPQPKFPDHCFSCGASSPKRFFDVAVRPGWGESFANLLFPFWILAQMSRSDIAIRVPACGRCHVRMARARAVQFLGEFCGIAALILAAFVSGFEGPSWIARSFACAA